MSKTYLLAYLPNALTNRHKNYYDAYPHITEHAPKVSTRSVHTYARKGTARQTDGQTHTHTEGSSKTTFLDVSIVVLSVMKVLRAPILLNFRNFERSEIRPKS